MDNFSSKAPGLSLALVVPKRYARRAVTRQLIKRQMREAVRRHLAGLAGAQVLIRQRSPFDPQQYPSASSAALRTAARAEVEVLVDQAARR